MHEIPCLYCISCTALRYFVHWSKIAARVFPVKSVSLLGGLFLLFPPTVRQRIYIFLPPFSAKQKCNKSVFQQLPNRAPKRPFTPDIKRFHALPRHIESPSLPLAGLNLESSQFFYIHASGFIVRRRHAILRIQAAGGGRHGYKRGVSGHGICEHNKSFPSGYIQP